MKNKIQIRYNTNAQPNDTLHWRVLINGVEYLASDIDIQTPCRTTKDHIEGIGWKWHITCESDTIVWEGTKCVIKPIPAGKP
jgi:hypothetical protein